MNVTVNGVVFRNPAALTVVVDVEPAGETLGPVRVTLRGGCLTVHGDEQQEAALLLTSESAARPYLVLEPHRGPGLVVRSDDGDTADEPTYQTGGPP